MYNIHMSNLLLAALVLVSIVNLALSIAFVYVITRIIRTAKDFISSPDGKAPAPASIVVDALVARASEAIMIQFKTTFMGLISGRARGESAAAAEVAEAAIASQSPLAATVMSAFPKLRKSFLKNPALLEFALSKLDGMGKGRQLELGGVNHTGAGFAANPGRYGG